MKIAVYVIARDEEKHVQQFFDSWKAADEIVLVDTGSSDHTFNAACLTARPQDEVARAFLSPWRFDDARNIALSLVSTDADVCIATDMDQIMADGWRESIEQTWTPKSGITRLQYTMVSSHNADGSNGAQLIHEAIHTRWNYHWVGPVHEALLWCGTPGKEKIVFCHGLTMHHWPDANKPREKYLPLLEMAYRERPDDCRRVFYLGREYWYRGKRDQAISKLREFLEMHNSTWCAERAEAMRILAQLHEGEGKVAWLLKSVAEDPFRRDQWVDLAEAWRTLGFWSGGLCAAQQALAINAQPCHYMSFAEAWGARPHDELSLCADKLGLTELAQEHILKALEYDPANPRLRANAVFMGVAECELPSTPPLPGQDSSDK
jgi:tetratricopeptide (TPR) repeat protein